MRYYLNIGSNLGNREGFLLKAVVELSAWGVCEALSHIVESEPWGFVSANGFLNMGVLLRSDLAPEALLDRLHAIERQLGSTSHRDSRGGYADRNVDIDIMAAENEAGEAVKIDSERLTLPHPHLHDRKFFIDPYRELKAASEKRK
ncbi:MAG: 2-amino-4-hydroxy-6-hydroxymethyldihydropteridine diphosphokinase [Sodaliphilus sp.]|nr:2-amino-4-hydroxy-6-hydroxymethyldihydropteridine diphosphokinase [Sodaliphilus sp.]